MRPLLATNPTTTWSSVPARAGCVLANRLSADRATGAAARGRAARQLPLDPRSDRLRKTHVQSVINWCYETEPEPELNGRRNLLAAWPSVLGGSSVDQRPALRPRPAADYDRWRQLGTRLVVRRRAALVPRAEDQERGADEFHGAAVRSRCRTCASALRCSTRSSRRRRSSGIPRNDDFNGAVQEGAGYYQLTTRNGRRCLTAVAYLKPVRRGRTCRSKPRRWRRVLFDGKRAVGVAFARAARRGRRARDAR